MKRLVIYFIFFINVFYVNSSDQIIKWDKSAIIGNSIQFDGEKLYFNDNKLPLDMNLISYIKFNFNEQDKNKESNNAEDLSVKELLKRAVYMQKKYPDSKALVLCDTGIEQMKIDGTRYSLSRYSVKIMNENELGRAMKVLYEIPGKIVNNIIYARSISPDGTIYNLSQDDIKFTEPQQGLEFFSGNRDARIMTVTIPGVKVGSIIDYKYETTILSTEDPKQYYIQWFFTGEDPVYESDIKIILPENTDFYYLEKNFGNKLIKPEIKTSGGYRSYYFSHGEFAQVINETQGPPTEEITPYIKGSTFKNQDYLSSWLSKLMKERMVLDDTLKVTVNNIIAKSNAKNDEDKISVLYRFVQEYIRYLSIKTSLSSGFSGHPATETFYNKYGDCIDKAILFATILNYIGVEAYPVIVMTNDEAQPLYGEIGVVSGNHAINEIHLKNPQKIIYLDSTGVTYRYPYFSPGDHGIKAWNPILNTVKYIDPPPIELNTQEFHTSIILDETGNGAIKKQNNYTGQMDSGLRQYFLSLNDIQKKALLRNLISNEYPGSRLINYKNSSPMDYENQFSLYYEYEAYNIAKKTGNYFIFNVPVKYGFNYTNIPERKFNLVFETTIAQKNTVEIILPQGFSPMDLPEPITLKSEYLNYEAKYTYNEGKIIFTDKYQRTKRIVPPKEYKEFRKTVLKITNFLNTPLIFEKK